MHEASQPKTNRTVELDYKLSVSSFLDQAPRLRPSILASASYMSSLLGKRTLAVLSILGKAQASTGNRSAKKESSLPLPLASILPKQTLTAREAQDPMTRNKPLTLTPYIGYLRAFHEFETEMDRKAAEGDGRTLFCEAWRHLLKEVITRETAYNRFNSWEVEHLPQDARLTETVLAITAMLEKRNNNLKHFVVSDKDYHMPYYRLQKLTSRKCRTHMLSYSNLSS